MASAWEETTLTRCSDEEALRWSARNAWTCENRMALHSAKRLIEEGLVARPRLYFRTQPDAPRGISAEPRAHLPNRGRARSIAKAERPARGLVGSPHRR